MITLHLVLRHHWFDLTEHGEKTVEYRAKTPRWLRLIYDRRDRINRVKFSRGYSPHTITRRVILIDIGPCPIPGWEGEYIRIHSLPEVSN